MTPTMRSATTFVLSYIKAGKPKVSILARSASKQSLHEIDVSRDEAKVRLAPGTKAGYCFERDAVYSRQCLFLQTQVIVLLARIILPCARSCSGYRV